MQKSLDAKLARLRADPSGAKDFIIADAKDADAASGVGASGWSPEQHAGEVRSSSVAEYRVGVSDVVRRAPVDVVLVSPGTAQQLAQDFDSGAVTAAVRRSALDAWPQRGSGWAKLDSLVAGGLATAPPPRSEFIELTTPPRPESGRPARRGRPDIGFPRIPAARDIHSLPWGGHAGTADFDLPFGRIWRIGRPRRHDPRSVRAHGRSPESRRSGRLGGAQGKRGRTPVGVFALSAVDRGRGHRAG